LPKFRKALRANGHIQEYFPRIVEEKAPVDAPSQVPKIGFAKANPNPPAVASPKTVKTVSFEDQLTVRTSEPAVGPACVPASPGLRWVEEVERLLEEKPMPSADTAAAPALASEEASPKGNVRTFKTRVRKIRGQLRNSMRALKSSLQLWPSRMEQEYKPETKLGLNFWSTVNCAFKFKNQWNMCRIYGCESWRLQGLDILYPIGTPDTLQRIWKSRGGSLSTVTEFGYRQLNLADHSGVSLTEEMLLRMNLSPPSQKMLDEFSANIFDLMEIQISDESFEELLDRVPEKVINTI
jgi:hypothetical protein